MNEWHVVLDAAYYNYYENCNVRGRGIDLRTSQRFRAGNEYTAEDEPTPVLTCLSPKG